MYSCWQDLSLNGDVLELCARAQDHKHPRGHGMLPKLPSCNVQEPWVGTCSSCGNKDHCTVDPDVPGVASPMMSTLDPKGMSSTLSWSASCTLWSMNFTCKKLLHIKGVTCVLPWRPATLMSWDCASAQRTCKVALLSLLPVTCSVTTTKVKEVIPMKYFFFSGLSLHSM